MSFLHHRKIYFANANYEAFSDFPVLFKVDNSTGAFPDLNAYNNLSFHAANGARIPWGCKEFNAGGVSWYKIKVPSIAKSDTDYCYMYYGGDTSTENKAGTCDANVVLETPMVDYGDTSHIEDWTGAYTLTKRGAATPAQANGDLGLCQDFETDTDDFIDTDESVTLSTTLMFESLFTLESVVVSASPLSNLRHSAPQGGFSAALMNYFDNGIVNISAGNGTSYLVQYVHSSPEHAQWSTGELYYLAVYYEPANNRFMIYVNGGYFGIWTYAGLVNQNTLILIGRWGITYTTEYSVDGKIHLARVTEANKSANWIAAQDKILRTQDYVSFGAQVDQIRSYKNPTTVLIKGAA